MLGGLELAPKKKRKKKRDWAGSGLYAQPAQIMFIKTYLYALTIIFMPIIV
jgi:hypothetical protein